MECLQWSSLPLPQLVTVSRCVWPPGMQHFRRSFGVYDVILVRKGWMYMREEDREYAIGPGHLLFLEPGMEHEGVRPCEVDTEIYWLHIKHTPATMRLHAADIPWSLVVKNDRDQDTVAVDQPIYMPKYGCFELGEIWGVLDEMIQLYDNMVIGSALQLQSRFVLLLHLLQGQIRNYEEESAGGKLALAVSAYLREHMTEGFDPERLTEALHFNQDYLARCLKRHTGMTPLEYLRHIRVDRACRLLHDAPELAIREVGARVGVEDVNYFIRLFRKEKGITPAAFRRQRRGYT